ncbi:hypothetical protein E3P86_02439 [Wallemia ichthyophaga]|uniref:Plasma membrane proteolipid 3 n=1 Tax=Wallemia ichthyophaga TaxID=245174 RepID=A0A4T0J9A1_WALIC|nr:hypothetical protein E3P86_02439 [Wallemia ichthyophaga]
MQGHNGCERILNGILAIFIPTLSVAFVTGCSTKGATHVLINLVLFVVLWIPAVIHAWYIIHHYRNGFYEDEPPRIVYVQGAQQQQQQQQSHQPQPQPQPQPRPQPQPQPPTHPQDYSLPSYDEANQSRKRQGDTKL